MSLILAHASSGSGPNAADDGIVVEMIAGLKTMRKDPARSIQPTLANLLTQTDRAIEYADAQVTAALERRDAAAARRALDAVHEYRDFRERVLYVINGWTQLRLPPEERTSAKIAEIVRRAKATVRDPSTAPDSPG